MAFFRYINTRLSYVFSRQFLTLSVLRSVSVILCSPGPNPEHFSSQEKMHPHRQMQQQQQRTQQQLLQVPKPFLPQQQLPQQQQQQQQQQQRRRASDTLPSLPQVNLGTCFYSQYLSDLQLHILFCSRLRPTARPTPRLPPLPPTSSSRRPSGGRSGGDPGQGSCPAPPRRSKVGPKKNRISICIFGLFGETNCFAGKIAELYLLTRWALSCRRPVRQKTRKKLQPRRKMKRRNHHHLQRLLSSSKKTEKNPTQSSTPLRPNPNPSPPPRARASPVAPRPRRPPRPRPPARPPRSLPSARRGTWTCPCPWRRR